MLEVYQENSTCTCKTTHFGRLIYLCDPCFEAYLAVRGITRKQFKAEHAQLKCNRENISQNAKIIALCCGMIFLGSCSFLSSSNGTTGQRELALVLGFISFIAGIGAFFCIGAPLSFAEYEVTDPYILAAYRRN